MQKDNVDEENIQKDVHKKYYGTKGGVFSYVTRRRMLGSKLSKRYRNEHAFWSEIAKYIKPTLSDLVLFIETANDEFVDEVLNRETLTPFVKSLLATWDSKPDKVKAEIAQLFVLVGSEYLLHHAEIPVTIRKDVEKAEEYSNLLVKLLGGEGRYDYGKQKA